VIFFRPSSLKAWAGGDNKNDRRGPSVLATAPPTPPVFKPGWSSSGAVGALVLPVHTGGGKRRRIVRARGRGGSTV
jgi:hypothetical protein